MSWVSGLFTSNIVNKTIDAIVDTGDALVYTDEEKAKAAQLAVQTKLNMLPLFEPFKLAQRYIALAFTFNFILAFWVGVIIFFNGTKEQFDGYISLVIAFELGWIMLAIISFYFGGGFMNSFNKKSKDK